MISTLQLLIITLLLTKNIETAINENNTTIINKVDQNIDAKIANNNTEINKNYQQQS